MQWQSTEISDSHPSLTLVRATREWDPCLSNLNPGLPAMTLQDGFAEQNLSMPIFKRRKRTWCVEIARFDVAVECLEQLLEGIGEPFAVTTGIVCNG